MIAAADFFTVEVWTRFGLLRYLVFFVVERATRHVTRGWNSSSAGPRMGHASCAKS